MSKLYRELCSRIAEGREFTSDDMRGVTRSERAELHRLARAADYVVERRDRREVRLLYVPEDMTEA